MSKQRDAARANQSIVRPTNIIFLGAGRYICLGRVRRWKRGSAAHASIDRDCAGYIQHSERVDAAIHSDRNLQRR